MLIPSFFRAEPLQYYGRDYTTQKDFLSISKISHLGEQVSTSETDNDANNEKSQETKAISLAAIIEQDGNSPNSNTSNDVNENGDWDVLPMVTSDDFWESAYRMERLKRKKLELKLHQLSSNSDYASKSDLFSQGDDEILAEDVIKHQQVISKASYLKEIVILLFLSLTYM